MQLLRPCLPSLATKALPVRLPQSRLMPADPWLLFVAELEADLVQCLQRFEESDKWRLAMIVCFIFIPQFDVCFFVH